MDNINRIVNQSAIATSVFYNLSNPYLELLAIMQCDIFAVFIHRHATFNAVRFIMASASWSIFGIPSFIALLMTV